MKKASQPPVKMPQRQYSKKQNQVAKPNPRVILPITHSEYQAKSSVPRCFRCRLDNMIDSYPELFPKMIEQGYTLPNDLSEYLLDTANLKLLAI